MVRSLDVAIENRQSSRARRWKDHCAIESIDNVIAECVHDVERLIDCYLDVVGKSRGMISSEAAWVRLEVKSRTDVRNN